jgi:hypothetical protein
MDQEIAFACTKGSGGCGCRFKSSTYETFDYPEREWLPYRYSATCPKCGNNANQANWQLGQWKAVYDNGRTGPSTVDGIKAISDANKSRDKASYAASRFNAITHGATASVAKYFPARPGKYDLCEDCEYLGDGCGTEMRHCAKRTELFVQFTLAQEQGDGRLLGKLMAGTQAGLQAIIGDMIRSIAQRGVEIAQPKFIPAKEGGIELAEYTDEQGNRQIIMEIYANPLLKPLMDFIHKNGMTLNELNLTPKAAEEEKRFSGYLDDKEADRQALLEAKRESYAQMSKLEEIIGRGAKVISGGRIINGESETN